MKPLTTIITNVMCQTHISKQIKPNQIKCWSLRREETREAGEIPLGAE